MADSELSYEHLLRNLKLAVQDDNGRWRPTTVGVLLFSERPDRSLSGAYVDLAVYDHAVADGNTRSWFALAPSFPGGPELVNMGGAVKLTLFAAHLGKM